jgi:hypothetical protein
MNDAFAPVVASIKQKIALHGHVIMGIGGGKCYMCGDGAEHEHAVPFCYTVGLIKHGFPEMIVFALDVRDGHRILDHLANMMRRNLTAFVHGQRISLGGKFPLLAIETDLPEVWSQYVTMPRRVFGRRDYSVVQLLVPDANGLYPPHCGSPYDKAPILSSRYPIGGH